MGQLPPEVMEGFPDAQARIAHTYSLTPENKCSHIVQVILPFRPPESCTYCIWSRLPHKSSKSVQMDYCHCWHDPLDYVTDSSRLPSSTDGGSDIMLEETKAVGIGDVELASEHSPSVPEKAENVPEKAWEGDKTSPSTEKNVVPFCAIFLKYATWKEVVFMLVGSIAAILVG